MDDATLIARSNASVDDDGRVDMSDALSDSQPSSKLPCSLPFVAGIVQDVVTSVWVLCNVAMACVFKALSESLLNLCVSCSELSSFGECLELL